MANFLGDQNLTGFYFESGTYANASGALQWLGLVSDFSPDENENVKEIRYQGSANRDVDIHVDGARDYTGKITFLPQDFRLLAYTLGSNVDSGSPAPATHIMTAINSNVGNAYTSGTKNPFLSMSLYNSQQTYATGFNFNRQFAGVVIDNYTLNISQGEAISADIDWIGQSMTFSSGAAAAITASTLRPFLWSDSVLLLSGSATAFKNLTFGAKNSFNAPHYCNGSKVIDVPQAQNRDYSLSVTVDGESADSKMMYDQFFQGGSQFNAMIWINVTSGTRDCAITLSGCRMNNDKAPTGMDGNNEQTFTIVPLTASSISHDSILKYNCW